MPPRSRMKRSQSFDSDIEIISDDSEAELDLALRAPAARPSTSSSTALALYGDGDAYQITGFGQGGLFQRNKRKKLLIQNDQRRTDDLEPGAAPPPQFFRSLAVYINGFTEGARLKQLSELLVRHGGVHIAYLDRKELVTHIVASNLTPSKREGFASYKVATSAWLIDSVAEGKLLDWRKYNLLAAPVLDPNSTALGDEVGKVAQRSLLGMGLGAGGNAPAPRQRASSPAPLPPPKRKAPTTRPPSSRALKKEISVIVLTDSDSDAETLPRRPPSPKKAPLHPPQISVPLEKKSTTASRAAPSTTLAPLFHSSKALATKAKAPARQTMGSQKTTERESKSAKPVARSTSKAPPPPPPRSPLPAPVVISSSPTDSQLQALKIDLDCFHALPLDLQLEHYADRKSRLVTSTKPALRDEQHQRVRDALDVHIVPPPVLKKRATTLEEIRELLELWVESAEGAPDDKDVKVVATFLEKALDRTSGQDMEMVGGILSWLEMLVQDRCGKEGSGGEEATAWWFAVGRLRTRADELVQRDWGCLPDFKIHALTTTFPLRAAKALCTVTRPSKGLFLLSMSNSPDNRLTPDYIKESLMPALDHIELTWRTDFANGDKEAALVITGERDKHKFFSNGLDLAVSQEYMGFFKDYYYPLLARVVTFPIHTVAAINGHCFAGGFLLAQACDTKIVRSERAWQCMNELDFGAPLPPGMASLLNHRLSPAVMRKTMLTAHRWTAPEALAAGFVDESVPGDGEAVITRALEIAESMKKHSTSGCLQMMKQNINIDLLSDLRKEESMQAPQDVNELRFQALKAAFERDQKKSKL